MIDYVPFFSLYFDDSLLLHQKPKKIKKSKKWLVNKLNQRKKEEMLYFTSRISLSFQRSLLKSNCVVFLDEELSITKPSLHCKSEDILYLPKKKNENSTHIITNTSVTTNTKRFFFQIFNCESNVKKILKVKMKKK